MTIKLIIFILLGLQSCSSNPVYFDDYAKLQNTYDGARTHLHFSEVISEKSYMKIINAVNSLGGNDTLVLHLNSPGGYVEHTLIIVEAMKKSKGKIIAQIDAGCYSGCAVLVGYADELIVGPHSQIMWHMPRNGMGVVFTTSHPDPIVRMEAQRFIGVLAECCTRYMYKKEAKAMFDGQDFFLTGKEFKRRWDMVHGNS